MKAKQITFSGTLSRSNPEEFPVLIVGHGDLLKNHLPFTTAQPKFGELINEKLFKSAVDRLEPSVNTHVVPVYHNAVVVAALPNRCSRHNAPSQPHALTKIVLDWKPVIKTINGIKQQFIVVVCYAQDVYASAIAIARAYPFYSQKTSPLFGSKVVVNATDPSPVGTEAEPDGFVNVEFVVIDNNNVNIPWVPHFDDRSAFASLEIIGNAVRNAARIVDTPCNEFNCSTFVQEAKDMAKELGCKITVVEGQELAAKGFGAIWAVGKAAAHPPAFVVLSHIPEATPDFIPKKIAWVGKGIVFDTGGLCIKTPKTLMCGMKRDCGGAAAVFHAFRAAVKCGFKHELHAVLCIAENSVSADATRPDDIIYSYSGRSIEINNTDAEGRLVLADGVAYAQKDLKADIIVDIATLTGAQSVATGKIHAAIITNNGIWEEYCPKVGRVAGELVFPLVYAPELHFQEFYSALADMKNSVASRDNATSSCAGLFMLSHLGFEWPGVWVHVDMAAPVHIGERASGYGVGLLLALFSDGFDDPVLHSLPKFAEALDRQDKLASDRLHSMPLTRSAQLTSLI